MRANQSVLIVLCALSVNACTPAPSIQPTTISLPTTMASSTAAPTLQPTPTPSPTATPLPTATVTSTASSAINPYGSVSRIALPDGKWTAVLDSRVVRACAGRQALVANKWARRVLDERSNGSELEVS